MGDLQLWILTMTNKVLQGAIFELSFELNYYVSDFSLRRRYIGVTLMIQQVPLAVFHLAGKWPLFCDMRKCETPVT
jgi:hypothetical protein